jgi:hypothetical protein
MKNLELWSKVEKTNPEYTKKANVKGNLLTSIAPQYQIKQATEQFGVYGIGWGFRSMEFDYTLANIGMATFKAVFYFPDGEFEIVNSVQLYKDGAQTKIDDDFAKKVETDTLTKALSKLGFNADIFLGKFDDTKYVQQMKQEFKEPAKKQIFKEGGFDKALNSDQKTILSVLSKYELTPDQKKQLTEKIKTAK